MSIGMDRPMLVEGCLIRKFDPGHLVPGVRLEDYCKESCEHCGFSEGEHVRRVAAIRAGEMEVGPDGLRRLRLPVIR